MKKICLIIVAVVMCLTLSVGLGACGFLGGSTRQSAKTRDEVYTYRYSSGSQYGNLTVNFTQKQFEYEGYTIYGTSSAFLLDPVMSCSGTFSNENYSQSGMDRYSAVRLTRFYIWVAQDKSYVLIGNLRLIESRTKWSRLVQQACGSFFRKPRRGRQQKRTQHPTPSSGYAMALCARQPRPLRWAVSTNRE